MATMRFAKARRRGLNLKGKMVKTGRWPVFFCIFLFSFRVR